MDMMDNNRSTIRSVIQLAGYVLRGRCQPPIPPSPPPPTLFQVLFGYGTKFGGGGVHKNGKLLRMRHPLGPPGPTAPRLPYPRLFSILVHSSICSVVTHVLAHCGVPRRLLN